MADTKHTEIALWILAGVSAASLAGALIGLFAIRRVHWHTGDPVNESVEELKERAEHVLGELFENVTELVGKSRDLASTSQKEGLS